MPYEILLQHASIVSCLCVFGISHFGLYYLYSSTKEYEANKGNGNVKRVKTEGRLLAMADDFGQYFNISNLVVIGGSAESEDANEAED